MYIVFTYLCKYFVGPGMDSIHILQWISLCIYWILGIINQNNIIKIFIFSISSSNFQRNSYNKVIIKQIKYFITYVKNEYRSKTN